LTVAYSIPEDIVEKVRESSDIVEVVSEHLPLKQAGRNFKALCPFHPEKTPSFMVSPEKQIYHCFGCGAGGNVFNFLMQIEGITFPEAVRALAKRYSIPVPKTSTGVSSETDMAYRMNALAAKIYRAALLGTKEGTQAVKYLRSRGIDENTEKEFAIGLAPSGGNLLVLEARRRKIETQKLVAMGLASEREGKVRDLFRRRIIFPIVTAGGRILGFGGRALGSAEPKYLNSPETRIFKKAQTIYGIHRAKGELRTRGFAIVVEGYMDAIVLHMNGFRNVIASLGTAFTVEQAGRIRRYCPEAVFLYDGDQAGRLAALRACKPAIQAGLKAKIVTLPEGEDPDSFVRKRGQASLRKLIDEARHYVDFILAQAPADDKEEAVRFALGIIRLVSDPIRSTFDLKHLSKRTGISEAVLERSLENLPRDSQRRSPEQVEGTTTCDKVEKSIVSILVRIPVFADRIFEAMAPADFMDHRMRKIVEVILDRKSKNLAFDTSALLSMIDEEPLRKLIVDCSLQCEFQGDADRIVSDHIVCMKRRIVGREIARLRKQIQLAEREGDAELLQSLLSRRQDLAQQLRLLST
jgi:DNA primase